MEALHDLIGSDGGAITWWQMSLRAAVIFLYLLVLVRLAATCAAVRSPKGICSSSCARAFGPTT